MSIAQWTPERRRLGQLTLLVLLASVALVASPARAATNLVRNPGVEVVSNGFPTCWERSGWGDQEYTFDLSDVARAGTNAMEITIESTTGVGDRKAMMLETPDCAPRVTPGHQYDLTVWYRSTTPSTAVTVFRHDPAGWHYWTDLATLPGAGVYTEATVRTPPGGGEPRSDNLRMRAEVKSWFKFVTPEGLEDMLNEVWSPAFRRSRRDVQRRNLAEGRTDKAGGHRPVFARVVGLNVRQEQRRLVRVRNGFAVVIPLILRRRRSFRDDLERYRSTRRRGL